MSILNYLNPEFVELLKKIEGVGDDEDKRFKKV